MPTSSSLPLAISMGCPAGIGPEILCKAWLHPDFASLSASGANCVVVGKAEVLRQAAQNSKLHIDIVPWQPGQVVAPETMAVFEVETDCSLPIHWGHPGLADGRVMGLAIEEALRLVRQGACGALVTCPVSKKQLRAVGYSYPGHTEMLAALTGTEQVRMMLAGPRLKVVLVTIHEPLRRVAELLTSQEIADCIAMTHRALQLDFGLTAPRIAVAGLNPHCGENGLFGDEEERIIAPAMAAVAARSGQAGMLSGPYPPDTVFFQAADGAFDAVIAMYHDQGLIPFKLLHFQDGVNVTLGLPIVRTSVDHGTAYDIAGKNLADPTSLLAAMAMAGRIVENRRMAA